MNEDDGIQRKWDQEDENYSRAESQNLDLMAEDFGGGGGW